MVRPQIFKIDDQSGLTSGGFRAVFGFLEEMNEGLKYSKKNVNICISKNVTIFAVLIMRYKKM